MIFIILPNQLFSHKWISKILKEHTEITDVVLCEEPIFFYDEKYKPFRINLVKAAYLRSAMKCFYKGTLPEAISDCGRKVVIDYVDYEKVSAFYAKLKKSHLCLFDPTDHDLTRKFEDIFGRQGEKWNIIEDTPYFIHTKTNLKEYVENCKKKRKQPRHATFYEFSKAKYGSDVGLVGVANMDKHNRSKPPSSEFMKRRESKEYRYATPKRHRAFYDEAIFYVKRVFQRGHVGNPHNCVWYPIEHDEAMRCFADFLEKRFAHFGTYQDAVMRDHVFMFHSIISPMLNCGLLNPRDIIEKTVDFYETNRRGGGEDKVSLAAYEGFMRQLLGWREYERLLYVYYADELLASNLPKNAKKIKDWNAWYYGKTGVEPLDVEIQKAVEYGYSHHIVRLMFFMNFMILCELSPQEIYKWFMEVVSMDAYSWVMISNIWSMGFFWKGGMSKPYISSSNYVLKMSDYKKDGEWDVLWNDLYRRFVSIKPTEYVFFYKRTVKKITENDGTTRTKDFFKKFVQ